ncbi:MAG: aminotransferase class III-fold pyridoxal phosphate-dependent enzyme [Xanthomonadales bacterium]|nr:aminotransferase class III-fold pyridoxal phosphate-dependent enzyme [Xanthomonadales bacterium]
MTSITQQLQEIRRYGGEQLTTGLPDDVIERFAARDPLLGRAVREALDIHRELRPEHGDLLRENEADQLCDLQEGLINFYAADAVNPYAALAARGPWIVTTTGAVVHDSGGYGMLGLGHAPDEILETMVRPHVMANVMTPSFSQRRLVSALKAEIGHTRADRPFEHFLFLNSGSEAVTVAARLSDVNAKLLTDPGGRQAGKPIRVLSIKGGFHGRTDRPAQFSDSTRRSYRRHLASFRDRNNLLTVPPNDLEALRQVYAEAEHHGFFIEAFFMEPVMGEGNPGVAVTPEFYRLARELTREHGSLLLVDSIQAGLRAHGCLSLVDYPGFQDEEAPDMETYSKALNAGQYPLSVLAMSPQTAQLYRQGIYGNTMTTNPRAMEVGCAVLAALTPEVRSNIRERGREFLDKLNALREELDGRITRVQGTGLLFSCELTPEYKAYGRGSIEEYLRLNGIGVIHGGHNSLRYTPHFRITSEEVDLIVAATRDAILNGPRHDRQSGEPLARTG